MQISNNEPCVQLVIEQDNFDSAEASYLCKLLHYGDRLFTSIPAPELNNLFELVGSANISAAGECGLGLDGTSYSLSIESGAYSWWMEPGKRWHPLGLIANEMQRLVFKIFGRY